ncbi:MAG: ATP-binding protein [Candidatus Micrarchaeia archaeon]
MLSFFKIVAKPHANSGYEKIFDIVGDNSFGIVIDLKSKSGYIIIDSANPLEKVEKIQAVINGLKLAESPPITANCNFEIFSVFRNIDSVKNTIISDLYNMPSNGLLMLFFIPVSISEAEKEKKDIEDQLENYYSRLTRSDRQKFFGSVITYQTDSFKDSDESLFFKQLINGFTYSFTTNNLLYKFFIVLANSDEYMLSQIISRFIIMQRKHMASDITSCIYALKSINAIPFSSFYLQNFISLPDAETTNYPIETSVPSISDGISIGEFLRNGVSLSGIHVKIAPSSFNLGFIITGLPGSGKTFEAMSIISQILDSTEAKVVIISPSHEWNSFAIDKGIKIIRLFDNSTKINFFNCPIDSKEKFYEDLALLIATASHSGPYQDPIEKCLLNAFRFAYSSTYTPNPTVVYSYIEDSIIKFHGKRTNTGVKYTKHGENIRSSLENLRSILSRWEYSSPRGLDFSDTISHSVVFDLSNVSGSFKPYIYALILNQIYSISSQFDNEGDNSLRLIILIEEAQILFDQDSNAAIEDLKRRIQDFRKQGISLILITHSITDISVEIRRLCQNKLYFKQPSDVASLAAKDFVFSFAQDTDIVLKLKNLDSRIAAFSYVVKDANTKRSHDALFVKTEEFNIKKSQVPYYKAKHPNNIKVLISLISDNSEKSLKALDSISCIKFVYLGEEISSFSFPFVKIEQKLLKNRMYDTFLYDKKGRQIKKWSFLAKYKEITIKIKDGNIDFTA